MQELDHITRLDDAEPCPPPQAEETDTGKIHVTFFRDYAARNSTTEALAIQGLRDLIFNTTASAKRKLPWLKLATFGSKKSDKGSLRHDANVVSISGIELDYDDEKISFDEAAARIKKEQLNALIYTSPSHAKDKPRWRILCPTSRDLPPTERAKLVARVNGLFGGTFSGESFTLSQGYYYGSVNKNPTHRCEYFGGDFIDQRDDLDASAIYKDDKPKANGKGHHYTKGGFETHLARLGDAPGLEGFHKPLRDAVASYVATHGAGFDRDALKAKLREAIDRAPKSEPRPYLNTDEHLDEMINSAVNKFGSAAQEIEPDFSSGIFRRGFGAAVRQTSR